MNPFLARLRFLFAGKKPPVTPKTKVEMITSERFVNLTQVVIDNFEGGYYHPNMKLKMKPSDQAKMGDSGETMFGLDRKHGAQLSVYPEWKEFWQAVDDAGAATNWKHYYRGGDLAPKLKELTAKIMYGWFLKLFNKYVTVEAQKAVANDDRLVIHFSYASWNGQGWFQKFAAVLNKAVKTYTVDKNAIFKAAIKARTESPNKVIRQQGANMLTLFKKYKITG